jgi:hypothetical protein
MIESAMKFIRGLTLDAKEIHQVEIHGKTYVDKNLTKIDPPELTEPEALGFSTLQGLVDFILSENPNNVRLHVKNPTYVEAVGLCDPNNYNNRFTHAVAEYKTREFAFGQWYQKEEFIIGLQSLFVQDAAIEGMLSGVSSIISSVVKEDAADNFSQHVQVKVGISLKKGVKIPNPIELCPFRTFAEVSQPPSRFAFRVRERNDKLELALFQADGDAWKLEAIQNIAGWLAKALPSVPVYA